MIVLDRKIKKLAHFFVKIYIAASWGGYGASSHLQVDAKTHKRRVVSRSGTD